MTTRSISPLIKWLKANHKRRKAQIRNVFESDFRSRVLLSYITKPFAADITFEHSNLRECYAAAEVFHKFGYRVDVVDFSSDRAVDYGQYEIIYGMGPVLEKSFETHSDHPPLRIFYATGCNPIYSNIATTLRLRDFYTRHRQLLMSSSRILRETQNAQIFLSDAVIVLGNQFVLDTYLYDDPAGAERYHRLDAFYNDAYDIDLGNKNFEAARKNFLWFGSNGLIHKGLDILLDIFSKREDIFLHICGAPESEREFFNCYKEVLSHSKNITNHGFVRMESDRFREIMNICGFVVSPSVSEGGSPSLLNVMANGGLVPIVTKSSGVDVVGHGFVIENVDIALFRDAIDQAIAMSNVKLNEAAIRTKTYARTNFTFDRYRQTLETTIEKIMASKGMLAPLSVRS